MAVAANGPEDPRKSFIDRLDLKMYEAAAGDLSLCGNDRGCLGDAVRLKSLSCAADVCDGTDKSKKSLNCFEGEFERDIDKYSKENRDQISSSICALIESPSTMTRQALLRHLSDSNLTEGKLVELGAYLLALKGSAASCENYMKDYIGTYGLQWTYQWCRALSGCRILARESTYKQEEKDFYTWFDVLQGSGHCSDIVNSEMRKACSTPGSNPLP
jgi:hypothetical protein